MVTLKDILRSATHSIRNATVDSDGQSTLDAIDMYLDEQAGDDGTPNVALGSGDAAAIERLSAELLTLCEQTVLSQPTVALVSSKPEAVRVHNQHYLILRFVHALLPILRPLHIFQDWWTPVLKPILITASYTDRIKNEARAIVSDCLIMEQQLCRSEQVPEPKYCKMIIDQYLAWAENYHKREENSMELLDKSYERDDTSRMRLQHQALLDLEQDVWSKNLKSILLQLGAAETKPFFMLLDDYFLSSKHRLQIVYLLSEFMLRKRTHLHEILETPLFQSMLKSLMYDNSTTLIAISVTNMIMLLPRICTSLPAYLPQLFYIFARAICWDQLRDLRKKQNAQPPSTVSPPTRTINDWDCLDYTFSKLSAPPSNPQTGPFFTSLYGLYPCNFLKFLHKPYAYFADNQFEIPEEFDEETFRSRTITQVQRHMLHPNLVAMDADTELTDRSRWMKMEPPDVIAQIMSLDLTNAASRVAFSVDAGTGRNQQLDLLDETVWDHTGQVSEVPTPLQPAHAPGSEPAMNNKDQEEESLEKKPKPVVINSILNVHKALKSGAEVLVGEDIWDAGLERFTSPSPSASNSPLLPESSSLTAAAVAAAGSTTSPVASTSILAQPGESDSASSETKFLIAALKREVLLLRNELNFELFLKQQHLQHIGRLHREHVFDSSVEAERQQLYNTTRMLKAQLKQTTAALESLKAETAMTKQKHIKWEDEQSGKLRYYREARKEWQSQMEAARQKLTEYEKCLAEQSEQLKDARRQIFNLENEQQTHKPMLEKVAEYEHRVKQLTQQMLLWEEDTAHLEEQKRYIKGLLSQWWSMEELVNSLQAENRKLQGHQSQQESELAKMKLQLDEWQRKASQFDLPPVAQKDLTRNKQTDIPPKTKEMEQLRDTMHELREKVELLEMEKLHWQSELELARYTAKTETIKMETDGAQEAISAHAPEEGALPPVDEN
ncbi:hypothetical protein EC973_000375 [Apophysomyces ossiformis]|uniref:Hamartin n=1 Tax=Apophysomyces ossiformis TaxID=679940 RepID=A0A8H7BRH2_9FUNG|nr:hypothetical protein EC973_000375 [Apophysomyces ossiformis]